MIGRAPERAFDSHRLHHFDRKDALRRSSVVILASAVFLGVTALAAADSTPPTTDEEKAWLTERQTEYAHDLADLEAARETLDNDEIRPLRHEFRTRTQAILDADTLDEAKAAAESLKTYLAAPGPAPSVAKNVHTVTRQFGSDAKQTLVRHQEDIESRLDLYP